MNAGPYKQKLSQINIFIKISVALTLLIFIFREYDRFCMHDKTLFCYHFVNE